MEFKSAEDLFDNGDYELAFDKFKQIAENEINVLSVRADSYNMMGAIVNGFAPYLDEKDCTGLKFFLKAIDLDENNIGALLNIVNTYGEDPSMHRNKEISDKAYKKLKTDLSDKINPNELERIKKK